MQSAVRYFFNFIIFFQLLSFAPNAIAQITGTLNLTGPLNGSTADWVSPGTLSFASQRPNRALFTVMNASFRTYQGYLSVKIYDSNDRLVAESIPEQQVIYNLPTGTTVLDLYETLPADSPSKGMRLIASDYSDKLKSGFIPEGSYRICVNVIDPTTGQALLPTDACRVGMVIQPNPPIGLLPSNGQEILYGERPILRWTPVSPRPSYAVSYRVRVFDPAMIPNGSVLSKEMVVRNTQPILDETVINLTQLVWPVGYELPKTQRLNNGNEVSKRYIWTVQSLDESGNPVGLPDGFSEPIEFFIIPNPNSRTNPFGDNSGIGGLPYVTVFDAETKKPIANAEVAWSTTFNIGSMWWMPSRTIARPVFTKRTDREGKITVDGNLPQYWQNITCNVIANGYHFTTGQFDFLYTQRFGKVESGVKNIRATNIRWLGDRIGIFLHATERGIKVTGEVLQTQVAPENRAQVADLPVSSPTGVTIMVKSKEDNDFKPLLQTKVQTGQKRFQFDHIPLNTSFYVQVGKGDELIKSKTYQSNERKDIDIGRLLLTKTVYQVKGKVTDQDSGEGVEGMEVYVMSQDDFNNFQRQAINGNANPKSFKNYILLTNDGKQVLNTDVKSPDFNFNIWPPSSGMRDFVVVAIHPGGAYTKAWQVISLRNAKNNLIEVSLKAGSLLPNLKGQITDAKSNKGVASARIELFNKSRTRQIATAYTNAEGYYLMKDINIEDAGDIIVYVEGWDTKIVKGSSIFNRKTAVFEKDISLEKTEGIAVLNGKLIDQFGKPLQGIAVTIEEKMAVTDVEGKFSMEELSWRELKTATLKINENGTLREETTSVRVRRSTGWVWEHTVISYRKRVALKLFNSQGKAIEGAEVRFDISNIGNQAIAKTNSRGEVLLDLNASKQWTGRQLTVSVSHPEYYNNLQRYYVGGVEWYKGTLDVSLTLRAKQATVTLRGTVRDQKDNTPIQEAEVWIDGVSDKFKVVADNEGKFEIEGLPLRNNYKVYARKRGFLTDFISFNHQRSFRDIEVIEGKDVLLTNQDFKIEEIFGFDFTVDKLNRQNGELSVSGQLTFPDNSVIQAQNGKSIFVSNVKVQKDGNTSGTYSHGTISDITICGFNGAIQNAVFSEGKLQGEIVLDKIPVGQNGYAEGVTLLATNGLINIGSPTTRFTVKHIQNLKMAFTVTPKQGNWGLSYLDAGNCRFNLEVETKLAGENVPISLPLSKEAPSAPLKITASVEKSFELRRKTFVINGMLKVDELGLGVKTPKLTISRLKNIVIERGEVQVNDRGDFVEATFQLDAPKYTKYLIADMSVFRVHVRSEVPEFSSSLGGYQQEVAVKDRPLKMVFDNTSLALPGILSLSGGATGVKLKEFSISDEGVAKMFLMRDQKFGFFSGGSGVFGMWLRGFEAYADGAPHENYFKLNGDITLQIPRIKTTVGNLYIYETGRISTDRIKVEIQMSRLAKMSGEAQFGLKSGNKTGFSGELELDIQKKFSARLAFTYFDRSEWKALFMAGIGRGIPIANSGFWITKIGGSVTRLPWQWRVAIETEIKPDQTIPMANEAGLRFDVGGGIGFGSEVCLFARGEGYLMDNQFAQADVELNITRGYMDGNFLLDLNKDIVRLYSKVDFTFGNHPQLHRKVFHFGANTWLEVFGRRISGSYFFLGNELRYLNEQVPIDHGVYFGFFKDKGLDYELSIGPAKIGAGYRSRVKGGMALGINRGQFTGHARLNAYALGYAYFSIGGCVPIFGPCVSKSIADVRGEVNFDLGVHVDGSGVRNVYGIGDVHLSGHVGKRCGDCNDWCLFGARGCLNIGVAAGYARGEGFYVRKR